ncbi:hypothetical protein JCM8097_001676 [Rhodosporidiobolus ruineniae]
MPLKPSPTALLRRARPPSSFSRPAPPPPSPSTLALGTAYELASLSFLARLPFELTHLLRIGGAGDGGVDLHGRWAGRPLLPPPLSSSTAGKAGGWPVMVQCKAHRERLQPAVVRELEGALLAFSSSPPASAAFSSSSRQLRQRPPSFFSPSSSSTPPPSPHHRPPAIALLLSLSGFTPLALARAQSSHLPLALLHLRPVGGVETLLRGKGRAEMELVSVGYSRALRGLVGAEEDRRARAEREVERERREEEEREREVDKAVLVAA